jgi:hypothetical protein
MGKMGKQGKDGKRRINYENMGNKESAGINGKK